MANAFRALFTIIAISLTSTLAAANDAERAEAMLAEGKYEQAFPILKSLADAGHPGAMYLVCNYYDQGIAVKINLKISFRYCEKAAELGHPLAMSHLASKYQTGSGVKADKQRAIELYEKAAELKDPAAMINLSVIYYHGDGAPKDLKKAFEYVMNAAQLGSPVGAFNVGMFYLQGLEPEAKPSSPLNTTEAVRWLRLSADMGYPHAYEVLGKVYSDPQLGLVDYEEAYFWLSLASEAGAEDISTLKFESELKLSTARRNRVKQRLNDWNQ